MDLCNISDIKNLLTRNGFRFSKSMGQNFLIADWVRRDIAEASGATKDCGVLEIGPGIGPLTVELSKCAGKVAAVELDRSLLPILSETLAGCDNVAVLNGDIMKLNLSELVKAQFSGLSPMVCANLPYNITTPILTTLLECHLFSSITVLIQREVARRICAAPGSGDYGSFSLFCQYHAQCKLLFEVPPNCFFPAPKVTSAVISITPRSEKPKEVEDEVFFFRVVRASFAQRRKTLLNGLSSVFGGTCTKEKIRQIIVDCGLPEDVRGEKLGIAEFAEIARMIKRTCIL